jgi:large subunit ribosomal protein L1
VLVFAQGENVSLAKNAGADHIGGKDLADKIKEGWLEFDVAIATPDMMGVVGPLGKVLGPRGLMPSPRAGTVTQDVANTVREYKAGKVEFRCDAAGIVHCVVGKMSFDETKLTENFEALLKFVTALKPPSAKGVYFRSIALTATSMPGIVVAA